MSPCAPFEEEALPVQAAHITFKAFSHYTLVPSSVGKPALSASKLYHCHIVAFDLSRSAGLYLGDCQCQTND